MADDATAHAHGRKDYGAELDKGRHYRMECTAEIGLDKSLYGVIPGAIPPRFHRLLCGNSEKEGFSDEISIRRILCFRIVADSRVIGRGL